MRQSPGSRTPCSRQSGGVLPCSRKCICSNLLKPRISVQVLGIPSKSTKKGITESKMEQGVFQWFWDSLTSPPEVYNPFCVEWHTIFKSQGIIYFFHFIGKIKQYNKDLGFIPTALILNTLVIRTKEAVTRSQYTQCWLLIQKCGCFRDGWCVKVWVKFPMN